MRLLHVQLDHPHKNESCSLIREFWDHGLGYLAARLAVGTARAQAVRIAASAIPHHPLILRVSIVADFSSAAHRATSASRGHHIGVAYPSSRTTGSSSAPALTP